MENLMQNSIVKGGGKLSCGRIGWGAGRPMGIVGWGLPQRAGFRLAEHPLQATRQPPKVELPERIHGTAAHAALGVAKVQHEPGANKLVTGDLPSQAQPSRGVICSLQYTPPAPKKPQECQKNPSLARLGCNDMVRHFGPSRYTMDSYGHDFFLGGIAATTTTKDAQIIIMVHGYV